MTAPAIYRVKKVCAECGAEWMGNSFAPSLDDEPPRLTRCDVCMEAEDAKMRELTRGDRGVEGRRVELKSVREAGTD